VRGRAPRSIRVSALELALAAKMAQRSLNPAARRAVASRWPAGVALVSPLAKMSLPRD